MAGWQILALYVVAAAIVTFLITLFFGDLDDDPPPLLLGTFWPLVIAVAVLAIPFVTLVGIQALAKKIHDATECDEKRP